MQSWQVSILAEVTGGLASKPAKVVSVSVMAPQAVGWVVEGTLVAWNRIWKVLKQMTQAVSLAMSMISLTAVTFR